MENKNNKKLGSWVPYVIVTLIAITLVVLVLFITHKEDKPQETDSTEFVVKRMDPAEVVAVTAKIREYYAARSVADAETLNRIVEMDEEFDAAELASMLNLIDHYEVKDPYILQSQTMQDYYIAYVTYDIYFIGINTGAPALDRFVLHNTDHGVVIDAGFVGMEFEEELEKTENTEVVKNLKKQVESDLEKATSLNHDLHELIQFMEGNLPMPSDEPSSSETAPAPASEEASSAEESTEDGSASEPAAEGE